MAITNQAYSELERDSKGLLDISASEFYFEKVRPHMQEMLLKCRTDKELIRTIEKVINSADSFCVQGNYEMVATSFDTLQVVITDRNYFNGVMSKAPEAEKEMVRDLITKISDLRMIIKCEPPYEAKPKQIKDRLNYERKANSPIGENKDYDIHNMKVLNESSPKKRIPNI